MVVVSSVVIPCGEVTTFTVVIFTLVGMVVFARSLTGTFVVDASGDEVLVVSCSPAGVVTVVVFTSSVVMEGPVVVFVTVETKVVSSISEKKKLFKIIQLIQRLYGTHITAKNPAKMFMLNK